VTLDPTGDNIRWRYAAPAGCRFLGTAVGSAGVAVLQSCRGAQIATLRLLDGFSGSPHWTRELSLTAQPRLLGAGALPTVLADGKVQAFSSADGTVLANLPVADGADVQVGSAGPLTLVRIDGRLTALDATLGGTVWDVPAQGLPASTMASAPGAVEAQPLLVPDAGAFVRRDPGTGAEVGRSEAPNTGAGGIATQVGPIVVLRLPDRVLGYR
jgi:outer membrane protein assembly factor BamB